MEEKTLAQLLARAYVRIAKVKNAVVGNVLLERWLTEAADALSEASDLAPTATETDAEPERKLKFGCRHLLFDPEEHTCAWGARLLHGEINSGQKGLVYDRQDAIGPPFQVDQLFPYVDRWVDYFRAQREPGSSHKIITTMHDDIMVRGSCQGSCGYVYVTAVMKKGTR